MDLSVFELSRVLRCHFSWHPARLICFCGIILGLFSSQNIHFWGLAQTFKSCSLVSSSTKRIQRFFKEQNICWLAVCACILKLLGCDRFILVIDRTNWKLGRIHKNYLVLSVIYKGTAVPILVRDLGAAGNSSTQERQELLLKFTNHFGTDQIECLLGDREFIGKEWFQWLHKNKIPFCIRLKKNTKVRHRNGGSVEVRHKIHDLKIGEYRSWQDQLWGMKVQLVGLKRESEKEEEGYVILVASLDVDTDLLPLYRKRWTIECLFKNIKSNGFRLEDSCIKHPERGEKLFAAIAIATALAVKVGTQNDSPKLRKFKKTKQHFETSIFSLGYKILSEVLRKISPQKIKKNQRVKWDLKNVLW
jgi:hypothetical protein